MSDQATFLELLDKCISDARIRISTDGSEKTVGTRPGNHHETADVALRIHNPRFFSRVLAYRNLGLGEAYMDGDFSITEGDLEDLLCILLRNRIDQKIRNDYRLAIKVGWIQLTNLLRPKHRNVQRHYDVGDDLFESFLDRSMAYSCGYAKSPHEDLGQLQINKFDRICRKLQLKPGDRLLDIGCGFGGLLIHAAKHHGVIGVGITNSLRHCERGNANISREGMGDRAKIIYGDYLTLKGCFDKVVSVGMMEHVPHREYGAYVRTIAGLLAPQGLGLVHAIACNTDKLYHDPFIQKYIFPGSGTPKLSEIAGELESQRLPILDVENIGRHYEYTARAWLKKFRINQGLLDQDRYDDVFQRMWEYYLCCGIAAAATSNDSAVYQVLFTKDNYPIPAYRVS